VQERKVRGKDASNNTAWKERFQQGSQGRHCDGGLLTPLPEENLSKKRTNNQEINKWRKEYGEKDVIGGRKSGHGTRERWGGK